jgi:hypothetical protein
MLVGVCYTKNSPNAIAACDAFYEGVQAVGGYSVKIFSVKGLHTVKNCDAIVQVCDHNKHCGKDFRYFIGNVCEKFRKPRIILDTGFIKNKRYDENDLDRYMQVGLNGIKRSGASYVKGSSQDRFAALELELKDWRDSGSHILILGQHEIGISTQHIDVVSWWENIIIELKKITDMPIKFRPHPNQTKFPKGKYEILVDTSIEEDLENCWCAISRTTNGCVDAIINGVPVITPDKNCVAYDISSHSIDEVMSPKMIDRKQWLYDLAYSQWTINEMQEGKAWNFIRTNIGINNGS